MFNGLWGIALRSRTRLRGACPCSRAWRLRNPFIKRDGAGRSFALADYLDDVWDLDFARLHR
jgi:hypothetical protein